MKKKKLLFITNIASNGISSFSISSVIAAKNLGMEYHIAGNFSNLTAEQIKQEEEKHKITIHHIDFIRNPLNKKNIKAYKQLKKLVNEEEFDAIHCNTPIGGFCGRLVAHKCKVKHVLYQAHGFHFYEGAPWRNWLLFYPIEKWLARYTDVLITINQEDYDLATKRLHLRNSGKVYYVPGVGMDLSAFNNIPNNRNKLLCELEIPNDAIILISLGDLIERKNYVTAIKAIAATKNEKIHYIVCGKGPEEGNLKTLCEELSVSNQVHFLGFRSDVKELLVSSDIFLLSSLQEGLPRSTMEAMSCGLPVICSKIRGNTDLIESNVNGYLCDAKDIEGFKKSIENLFGDSAMRKSMGEENLRKIKAFGLDKVVKEISKIYEEIIKVS